MSSSASSRSQISARILMVDDNSMGLMARRTVLEDQGYEVVSLACPDEALSTLTSQYFDLFITDYKMPAMTGVDLIRKVRESNCTVPAILLSGFAETLGLDQGNTGADAVIQKNASEIPHLLRTVRTLLRAAKRPPKSEVPPTASRTRRKKA